MMGGLTAAVTGGVLGVATYLTPSAEGLGTHTQLGMKSCGWVHMMGIPCPTCGMTTSFAHAAEGDLPAAFHTQPLGAVLAVATAMAFLLGVHTLITGSTVGRAFARMWTAKLAWVVSIAVVAAWLYKVASFKGYLP